MTYSPSLEQLKQAIALKEQIAALENQITAILGGGETPVPFSAPVATPHPLGRPAGGKMSPEARARIAAAQKERWAKFRESKGLAGGSDLPKAGAMSREERGRVAAKARWSKFHAEQRASKPAKVGKRAVSGRKPYVFTAEHRARLAAAQQRRFAKLHRRG